MNTLSKANKISSSKVALVDFIFPFPHLINQ